MKRTFPRIFITTLLFVSALVGTTSANAAPMIPSAYYNNCGAAAVFMPSSITQFCGDAGAGVVNIKWSYWGAKSAKGVGTYYVNACDPTCVAGKVYKTTKVVVVLSGATKTHGKNYLMNVTVTPEAGKKFVWPPKQRPVPKKVTWITDMWRS